MAKMAIQMPNIIIDDIISGQYTNGIGRRALLAYAAVTKSPEEAYEAILWRSWQGRIRISDLSTVSLCGCSMCQEQGVARF